MRGWSLRALKPIFDTARLHLPYGVRPKEGLRGAYSVRVCLAVRFRPPLIRDEFAVPSGMPPPGVPGLLPAQRRPADNDNLGGPFHREDQQS
jgi:hypothetical protein